MPSPAHDRTSWWHLAAAPSDRISPAPAGHLRSDVVVIGGGVAGLVIAAALHETGREVVVLEADRVGSGVTGSSTAKVTALHGATYHSLERTRGPAAARAYGEANLAAVERFEHLVDTYGLDCGWSRLPAFSYTVDAGRRSTIAAEVEAAAAAGLPATATTDTGLPLDVEAAVRCEHQGQLDPVRFTEGLARALARRGVRIVEHARVGRIDQRERHVVDAGEVRVEAPVVVQATQMPIVDPGLFFAKVSPVRSYALAATLAGPVPEGMYLSIDEPSRSVRPVDPGSSTGIFGGGSHRVGEGGDTTQHAAELEAWVRSTFDVRSIEAQWSAQDLVPADDVPYIGRMPRTHDGMLVATGFKKWGFTSSGVAASILTDLVEGRDGPWATTFDAGRAPLQPAALGELVASNVRVAGHFVGDRLLTACPSPAEGLAVGEGGIVEVDGTRVAAHRDADGVLHAVSATCTHLGCLVAWNSVERSWDCPCHGSRFGVDGRVITGPATAGLAPVDVDG